MPERSWKQWMLPQQSSWARNTKDTCSPHPLRSQRPCLPSPCAGSCTVKSSLLSSCTAQCICSALTWTGTSTWALLCLSGTSPVAESHPNAQKMSPYYPAAPGKKGYEDRGACHLQLPTWHRWAWIAQNKEINFGHPSLVDQPTQPDCCVRVLCSSLSTTCFHQVPLSCFHWATISLFLASNLLRLQ